MRFAHTLLFLGLALGLAACDRDGSENTEPVSPTPSAANDDTADTVPDAPPVDDAAGTMLAASATATLQPAPGGTAGGTLAFAVADGGVRMTGTLTGLTAGRTHAMHIHTVGDCSAPDFTSAGDHFNPTSMPHGDRTGTGSHHAGDMPNQTADGAGNASVDQLLDGLQIDGGGATDIVGKSVVVHANADDYVTQPSGASGGRIACGVIELENPAPAYRGPADAGAAADATYNAPVSEARTGNDGVNAAGSETGTSIDPDADADEDTAADGYGQ